MFYCFSIAMGIMYLSHYNLFLCGRIFIHILTIAMAKELLQNLFSQPLTRESLILDFHRMPRCPSHANGA